MQTNCLREKNSTSVCSKTGQSEQKGQRTPTDPQQKKYRLRLHVPVLNEQQKVKDEEPTKVQIAVGTKVTGEPGEMK